MHVHPLRPLPGSRRLAVALAVLLPGCQSSTAGELPASDWTPLAGVSDQVERYFRAFCEHTAPCYPGEGNLAGCRDYLAGQFCGAGFAELELPELDACTNALATAECEPTRWPLHATVPACAAAAKALTRAYHAASGRRELGEACGHGTSCGAGTCSDDDGCGTCVPLPAEGEPCSEVCGDDGLRCVEGTCRARLSEGATCERAFDCASNICLGGRCQTPLSVLGRTCETLEDCGLELPCIEGKCAPALPNGAPCDASFACKSRYCWEGTCIAFADCMSGGAGDVCLADAHCAAPLVCSGSSGGTCVEPSGDGAACQRNETCSRASFCEEGMCRPKRVAGEACAAAGSPDATCSSGFCNQDATCADAAEALCEQA